MAVDDLANPTLVRFHLKRSKCDQFGRGVDVFIGRTGDELCPVTAVLSFIARRGPKPGSFFLLQDGSPLTKGYFVGQVQKALTRAGIQSSNYTGHSFRSGAATAAANAGVEDSVIQMLGRWNSPAFLTYIRTPRDQLAGWSQRLVQSPRGRPEQTATHP